MYRQRSFVAMAAQLAADTDGKLRIGKLQMYPVVGIDATKQSRNTINAGLWIASHVRIYDTLGFTSLPHHFGLFAKGKHLINQLDQLTRYLRSCECGVV